MPIARARAPGAVQGQGKKVSDYLGGNDKTKIVAKLQRKGAGAARIPRAHLGASQTQGRTLAERAGAGRSPKRPTVASGCWPRQGRKPWPHMRGPHSTSGSPSLLGDPPPPSFLPRAPATLCPWSCLPMSPPMGRPAERAEVVCAGGAGGAVCVEGLGGLGVTGVGWGRGCRRAAA
jgi:hypothetical protein